MLASAHGTVKTSMTSTFATIELVAPLYGTLLQIDPLSYPKVIGDVATGWNIAADGLTYTFKDRPYLED